MLPPLCLIYGDANLSGTKQGHEFISYSCPLSVSGWWGLCSYLPHSEMQAGGASTTGDIIKYHVRGEGHRGIRCI